MSLRADVPPARPPARPTAAPAAPAAVAAGYIIGWADLMGGLRGYWLWTSLGYAAALVLLSLSANAALPPWVARFVQVSPEFLALTPQDALVGAALSLIHISEPTRLM
jgi:hypothetical protein